jgi:hypothetical protein
MNGIAEPLKFESGATPESYAFLWSRTDEPYLHELRRRLRLEEFIDSGGDAYWTARTLSYFVHGLWDHGDAVEATEQSDPISILKDAEQGKAVRCIEYARVLTGCLVAVGVTARIIGLKQKNVETMRCGAGHVVTEAYLPSLNKWILVDPQFDAIPIVEGYPLNAVELQRSLATRHNGLTLASLSGTNPHDYFRWILPYLFYFDTRLDQRVTATGGESAGVMLVPLGVPPPRVMQREWPMGNLVYTHSVRAFYAAPSNTAAEKRFL